MQLRSSMQVSGCSSAVGIVLLHRPASLDWTFNNKPLRSTSSDTLCCTCRHLETQEAQAVATLCCMWHHCQIQKIWA